MADMDELTGSIQAHGLPQPLVVRKTGHRDALIAGHRRLEALRPHLAGALGAALCTAFLDQGWVTRHPGCRALRITQSGRRALAALASR
jgi:hypothetical protein